MFWYSLLFKTFPQFAVIHTVRGFGIVNKAELDAFLELSCFFDDSADVGNLISGSSVFSKSSLNIWKLIVYTLLKPDLENFELHMKGLNSVTPEILHPLTHRMLNFVLTRYLIFDVQTAYSICCKLLCSLTSFPASLEQFSLRY